jgi:hypothetical protein
VNVGAYTPTVRVVVAVKLPDVPMILTLYCPRLAELVAVNVNVLLPVVGFGENDPVTPLGSPVAESVTLPLNPFCGVM